MMANMLGQIVQYSDSSEAGSDDDDERSDSKGDNKQKSDAVPSTGSNIETRNSPEPKKRWAMIGAVYVIQESFDTVITAL